MPYISHRWLKGLLTNWENSCSSIKFYNLFLKKLGLRNKQKLRMSNVFKGLNKLNRLPDAIVILDPLTDIEALREANALNIPIIAVTDTGVPLHKIDYPVIGNSDSTFSLAFFATLLLENLQIK